VSASAPALADQVDGYGFHSAAQEITQLFWLADTAEVCGWTTSDEAVRFKSFSLRFLSAHLSEANKLALVSMVTQAGYQDKVHRAAEEGAADNCTNNRWQLGWSSYKTAADEHESNY
jgi:type VI protein secretion system component VasK